MEGDDKAKEVPASEGAPDITGDARESRSILVDKRMSTISKQQSHVRVVEPGDAVQSPDEPKPSGEEGQNKNDVVRQSAEMEKKGRQFSSSSDAGARGSRQRFSGEESGMTRRRSDRPSKTKAAVGSTISIRRTSGYGESSGAGKAPKFMNTYKLDSDNPFQPEKVEKILQEVLIEALDNLTYDSEKCPKQAKWASSAIRAKVKEQEYDRYKLICLVTIGEKRYHDMCSVIRFLWDIDRDKYALFVHENMHVYAAAMCFALYYE